MQKPILVVGATGNVGSALIRTLKSKGISCIAGIRNESKAEELKALGVPLTEFNFDDPQSMERAFQKAERVFLLLPLTPRLMEHGKAAIEAAKNAGVSYIVRSSEFRADPASPRLAFRAQGEVDQALKESGTPCAIIRPNFFMQNFAVHYRESIRKQHAIMLPQGAGSISFVDVRDIAEVAAHLLISPDRYAGHSYDLTGPQPLSNSNVASILSQTLGKPVEYLSLADEAASDDMKRRGVPEWSIEFVMSLHRHVQEGRMAEVTNAVGEITGKPPRTLAGFIKSHSQVWT
jgi:uncharacterized protein YbjT (DUF2867 family)